MAAVNVVSHGRRKGSVRSGGDAEIDPSQIAVLPSSEWKRIRDKYASWQAPAPSKAAQMQMHKEALHEHSKEVVKNWENTIEGQRLKRLQARQLREEEEENAHIKIDEEEAKFQAEERKKAIERAKTLLYYQTDRVRQLNGALVLSEVLREREAQIVHKKKRQDLQTAQDTKLLKLQAEEREEATLKDIKAAEEKAKERAALCQHHLKQKDEKVQKKLQARLASLDEQKQLDQEATEYHLKRRDDEEEALKQKAVLRQELDACMLDKERQAAEEKKQSEIDEEKMKIYSRTKRQMEKLRKEKEVENKKEFQRHQKMMCDNLQNYMEAKTSDEDQRIADIVQKQLAKRDAELHEKQQKYMEATRAIYQHTVEQMAEAEQQKRDNEEMEKEMLKQRVIQDQKFHAQQLDKQLKAKKDALALKEFQQSQMVEIEARKREETDEDIAYNLRNMKLLQIEEDQFQQYAGSVLHGAAERKAPLLPLMTAAREGAGGGHGPMLSESGVRPSYLAMEAFAVELPSYATNTSKKKARQVNTQKRLGFIW